MARKRSRSPFPVTRPRRRFTLPSFLSPLRRSIRSFPLLGGVSRRCNLRLNCQSTGYYFPVSLPGRSGRLGAEPGGRQEKTERVPWRKLAPGEGRAIDPCFFPFFSLNGWVSCVLLIAIVLLSANTKHFFVFFELSREGIKDFQDVRVS